MEFQNNQGDNMPGSWLKETFEKGVDELQKLAKTGSIKIDIANLKKKRDERVKLIGNKVLAMINKGELKAEIFEPDYSYVLDMDRRIELKEAELLNKEPEDDKDSYKTPTHEEPQPEKEEISEPEPQAPAAPKPTINENDEDEHDPHEDYINRPG